MIGTFAKWDIFPIFFHILKDSLSFFGIGFLDTPESAPENI